MSKREVRAFLKRSKKADRATVAAQPVEPSKAFEVSPEDVIALTHGERHLTLVEAIGITEADGADVIEVEETLVVEPEVTHEPESEAEAEVIAENTTAYDSYPSYDEVDGIEEDLDGDDDDDDEGPTTIAEATAALALAEAIAAHNAARIDNGLEIDDSVAAAAAIAALSDDMEPFSVGVSTATGSIPTISNALILPTLPEDTATLIPIAVNTGEIMITESVSIPSSIAQLGAHLEAIDTSEVDVIVGDEDITVTDALAPVSATTAVSSYNLNNAVVTVPRRMSDRLPLVLSVTAAGLAVAVVALFVAGYFLGIF